MRSPASGLFDAPLCDGRFSRCFWEPLLAIPVFISCMSDSTDHTANSDVLRDTYEAAQRRIDYQTQLMRDLDNKALKTFRLALLIAGLILTGVSAGDFGAFIDPDSSADFLIGTISLAAAIVFFFITVVLAFMTARVSTLDSGPESCEIDRVLTDGPTEEEWLESALERQSTQIEDNSEKLENDQESMKRSQIAFIITIFSLFSVFIFWF